MTSWSQIIQSLYTNLQILATEMFKVKNSLTPKTLTEIFEIKEPHYNLRFEASHFKRVNVKYIHYGIQSVNIQGQKYGIYNTPYITPQHIRESKSLNKFKSLIKFWKPDTCHCRLCKNYIVQVGFISSHIHRNIHRNYQYLFFTFIFFQLALIRLT